MNFSWDNISNYKNDNFEVILKLRQPKNLTFVPVELEPNQSRKFMIIQRITFCDKGPRRQVKKSPKVEKKYSWVYFDWVENASSYAPEIESKTMEKQFESSSETKKRGRYSYLLYVTYSL